jgi:hypothetical protein
MMIYKIPADLTELLILATRQIAVQAAMATHVPDFAAVLVAVPIVLVINVQSLAVETAALPPA